MMKNTQSNLMLDVLRGAFPGRTDKQLIPIALVYAGVLWGKDHRYCAKPAGSQAKEIRNWFAAYDSRYWTISATARLSKPRPVHPGGHDPYFAWLSAYLSSLRVTPNEEQSGLCQYVSELIPQDAVFMIGLNAALYQHKAEPTESWIRDGRPFSAWLDNYVQYVVDEDEEIDENILRQEYDQVAAEMQERQTLCPLSNLADLPWRAPLALAVRKAPGDQEKIELIETFYEVFNEKLV